MPEDSWIFEIRPVKDPFERLIKIISKRRFTAQRIALPSVEYERLVIIIESDEKSKKINDNAVLQNVRDKFRSVIYGKKFNVGMRHPFGAVENIQPNVKGSTIILRIPASFENDYVYGSRQNWYNWYNYYVCNDVEIMVEFI